MTRAIVGSLVLLLAVTTRCLGLDWGLPRVNHPDEERVMHMTIGVLERSELKGSDYGVVVPRLNAAVIALLARVGVPVARGGSYDWSIVIRAGRAVATAFGIFAVGLAFLCGQLVSGFGVGLLAAFLVTVSPLHVQLSHMMSVDVHAATFCGLVFFGGLVYRKRPSALSAVLCGGALALAVSTKLSALAAVPMAFVLLVTTRPASGRRLRDVLLLGVTFSAVLALLHHEHLADITAWLTPDWDDPLWWHGWNFPEGAHTFLWNVLMTQGAFELLWTAPSRGARLIPIVFGISLGLPLVMGLAVAIPRLLRVAKLELGVLGIAAALLTLPFLTAEVRFGRYVLIAIVPLCVFAAAGMADGFAGAVRRGQIAYRVLVASMAAFGLYAAGVTGLSYLRPHNIELAISWIHGHVPAGSVIGMARDYYFSVDVDERRHAMRALDWMDLHDRTVEQVRAERWPVWLGSVPARASLVSERDRAELERRIAAFQADLTHIVLHERSLKTVAATTDPAFEPARAFHRDLVAGKLGFELVKIFSDNLPLPFPGFDDRSAEHTTRIFDHGDVLLFARAGLQHPYVDRVDLTEAQRVFTDIRLSRAAAMQIGPSQPRRARELLEHAHDLVRRLDPSVPWLVNADGASSRQALQGFIETDLGWADFHAMRYERAAEFLAGALGPPEVRPWAALGLATTLLQRGMHQGALSAWHIAAASPPPNVFYVGKHANDVTATYARIQEARGERRGAITTLERLLRSRDAPVPKWPRTMLAKLLLEDGRALESIVVLGSAPRQYVSALDSLILAEAYLDLGELGRAADASRKIPQPELRDEMLARIATLTGQFAPHGGGLPIASKLGSVRCDAARKDLRRRCAFHRIREADLWERLGRGEAAERAYREAVALDRGDPVVLAAYGRAAARRGDCAHAITVLEEARRVGASPAWLDAARCRPQGAE